MKRVRVVNERTASPLAEGADVAERWWPRLRGLLGRSPLAPGEGLLLRPCRAVHTWGMRYSIDVAFLDAGSRVIASYPLLAPGGRTRWHATADAALELPAGVLVSSDTREGDAILCLERGDP